MRRQLKSKAKENLAAYSINCEKFSRNISLKEDMFMFLLDSTMKGRFYNQYFDGNGKLGNKRYDNF